MRAGNSGVITSQILRGLVDGFPTLDEIDGAAFTAGLRTGADAAYQAVMRPVEGTILTVVREAAEAVEAAGDASLGELLERGFDAACRAVEKTPEQLPVLREAGVVDAGGKGFTLAARRVARSGRRAPDSRTGHRRDAGVGRRPPRGRRRCGPALRGHVPARRRRCDDARGFANVWSAIGDSIVVVGGDGLWNCHIHTNDIGGSIEAGLDAGRPRNVRVTDLLLEQVE